ncbi:DUF5702 domain-containing protein [Vallitalea okinawensis]|uniref:DUF5702 domain-containing protein n=1 Tax=Vallitalea okinawensis TaxID=2078660 RepID=UPI000CFD30C4|nr:DUF5702 domain-containing protein [Vallitalea okinawensis]
MEQRGSITVLLSSVFLCLILIGLTLIDSTLIYMGHVQANRAVSSASYSLLGEYYVPLMEEYGLFGVNQHIANDKKAKDYIVSSLNPYEYVDRKEEWQLYHYDVLETSVVHKDMLIQQEILEAQILEYMKYRGPLSAIEPFIIKVESIGKVAATGHLMKVKAREVDEPIIELNHEYEKLIQYVEGFKPKNKVEDYFIKMLIVPSEYYTTDIPDQYITNQLNAQLLVLEEVESYIDSLPTILEGIYTIKEYEIKIDKIEEGIDQLENDSMTKEVSSDVQESDNQETSDTMDDFNGLIEDYSLKIGEIENRLIDHYGKEGMENYNDLLSYIEERHQSYKVTFDEILSLTQKSIKVIDNIEKKSSDINEGILTINEDITINQEKYDLKTIESINKGLKDIENKIYSPHEDLDMSNKSSIKRMGDIFDRNKDCITLLNNELKKHENLQDFLLGAAETAAQSNDFITMNEANTYFNALKIECNNVSLNYSSDIQFEFGDLQPDAMDPKEHMNNQLQKSKDHEFLKSRQDNLLTDENGLYEEMPSIISQNKKQDDGSSELTIDDDGAFKDSFFNQLSRFDLGEVTEELLYEIYINEYILEVFNDVVESEKIENDSQYMQYQVEYVIGGQFNDFKNAKIVEAEIVLIRSAMNFLHIFNCTEKKAAIKFLANSIAGWWSAGVGTIIVQAVLMGIWAIAESFVDISRLIKGEEVAFYKLESDWVLSLDGMISFGIDKLSEEAIELVTNTIDEMGDKILETGSDMMEDLSQITSDNIEAFLEDSANRMTDVVKVSIDQMDEEVNRVIYGTAEAIILGKEIPSYPHLYDDLVVTLQEAVLEKEEMIKEYGYDVLDQVVDYTLDKSMDIINDYREKLIESGKEVLGNLTNQLQEDIKYQATDVIEGTMQKWDEELTAYVKDVPLDDTFGEKPSKVPSIRFAYVDYLRLLLLIQPDDIKMYRTADLIQLSIIEDYNEDFRLSNYTTTIQVDSVVTKPLLFSRFLNLYVKEENRIGDGVKYEARCESTY